jgi:hypothetical protein
MTTFSESIHRGPVRTVSNATAIALRDGILRSRGCQIALAIDSCRYALIFERPVSGQK